MNSGSPKGGVRSGEGKRSWGGWTPWIIGGVPTALAIVRIARISEFDAGTAGAILTASGTVTVFTGSLIPVIPTLLMFGSILLVFATRRSEGYLSQLFEPTSYMLVLGVLIFIPWDLLAIFGVLFVVLAIREWRARRTEGDLYLEEGLLRGIIASLIFLVFVSPLFIDDLWVSREILEIENEKIVGFVLEDDGRWATILEDEKREVRYVDVEALESRNICKKDSLF